MDKLDSDRPPRRRAGTRRNFGPELEDGEQRKQVRQALDDGENVQAKVTVKATDAAGNVATAKRTITLGSGRSDGRTPPLLGVKRRK